MLNTIKHWKNGELFIFKYEVGREEGEIINSVGDYISKDMLDCFDAALIREKLDEALSKKYG